MTSSPNNDVFVSYSHEDLRAVQRLVDALIERGLTIRWDHDVQAGDDWAVRLAELAAEAAAVVVVWSKASASSSHVVKEATKAELEGTLVPASIDGLGAIPDSFRSLQTVDLSGWDGDLDDPRFEGLFKALSARILQRRPATVPLVSSDAVSASLASLPVRPAAREILLLAVAVAVARGGQNATALDVLLACLLQGDFTKLDRAELARSATAGVVRAVPEPRGARITAALRATGADRSMVVFPPRRPIDDSYVSDVRLAADGLARRVGAAELSLHHVVAAALVQPVGKEVLDALGVDQMRLRTALRASITLRWPSESSRVWDDVLRSVPPIEVEPAYRDRVFAVDTLGSQGIRGLAVLIDESNALTLSSVVSSLPLVLLEALGTRVSSQARVTTPVGNASNRIAVLEPLDLHAPRSRPLRLDSVVPLPNTPIETVGLDESGNPFLLRGVAGSTAGTDLIIHASEPLASGVVLTGAPVTTGGRVIGLVSTFSADQLHVIPSAELLRAVGAQTPEGEDEEHPTRNEAPESIHGSTGPRGPEADAAAPPGENATAYPTLSTPALDLIAAAMYVHGDHAGPIEPVEVLLGGLGAAWSGEVVEELTALWAAVPDDPVRSDRIGAALGAIGSVATFPFDASSLYASGGPESFGLPATDLHGAALPSVIADAHALHSQLGGRGPIEVRHLLAVVLGGSDTVSEVVETALGVSMDVLRQSLRDAVHRGAFESGEPEALWDDQLRADKLTLVRSIDSDLVVWDNALQLEDHLEIDNYVNMLSLVVASIDTPLPLSIGLFGPWGSGKTYFMGLMRQAINRLSDQAIEDLAAGRSEVSCARIVPITFNAWHYADANLWASLAVRIFDELAGKDKKKRTDLETRRQELIKKLTIYQELESKLAEERTRADHRAQQLAERLKEARKRKKYAEEALAGLRAGDILAAAKNDPRLKQLWTRTSGELRKLGIEPNIDTLTETAVDLAAQVQEAVTLRAALEDRGRIRALATVVPVLAVFGVVLLIAPGVLPAVGGTSIVAALAVAGRVTTWLQQRATEVQRVLNHVEATISVADDARLRAAARNRVEIEHAERELEIAQADLADVADREASATAAVLAVDRQLADLKAGARLQRFIAERSASSDYQRQLGVVSMARRDFEDLTTALREAIDDYRAGTGEPPVVDRIVLYIDDLDRCSAERVVQVLEAVHLLLAMDLFVVVVGVDPRWLLRSLRQQFRGVLSGGPEQDSDGELWQWTPQNYLEKIFQIPFVLPVMSPIGYKALLESLATPSGHGRRPSSTAQGEAPPASARLPDENTELAPELSLTSAADPVAIPFERGSPAATMTAESRLITVDDASTTAAPFSPRLLDLTRAEIVLLGRLAPLVRTPRVAKRMLNIYRMLRITRDLGPASKFLAGDYQAVCQLLSLSTGYPQVFSQMVFGDPTAAPKPRGLLDRSSGEKWSGFVDGLSPLSSDERSWTNAVAKSIPPLEVSDWTAAIAALASVRSSLTLPDTLEPYQRWAPRIARFSFELSPFSLAGRP